MPLGEHFIRWKEGAPRASTILGSLLLFLIGAPLAHAITSATIDGDPSPIRLVVGETVTIRFDAAMPGAGVDYWIARDTAGTGRFDPAAPLAGTYTLEDDGGADLDPAPGRVVTPVRVSPEWPAGPYVLHFEDLSDGSTVDLPVTVVPQPQPQAISGSVTMGPATNPPGTPLSDTIIWAYSNAVTAAASADIQPDGSYSLPVPPGNYLVFAEWFGNWRSPRRIVSVSAGQQLDHVDLPLLQGQEVSGFVRAGDEPIADALVQAASTGGQKLSTQTFIDGSYTLILPPGQYEITAGGGTAAATVADEPLDGIDFPPVSAASPLVPGTIVTVAGNRMEGFGGDGRPAISARVSDPLGVAVDRAGNLYIADGSVYRVRRVDAASGLITTVAGSSPWDAIHGFAPSIAGGFSGDGGPATQALLNAPQHAVVDAAGNLYISEVLNHRIRRVDTRGIITTVVGTGQPGFSGDGGPAASAEIDGPQGMAVDAAGNLYFSDNHNHRVRKVSTDGTVTTVAGGGTDAVRDGAPAAAVALSHPLELAVDGAGSLFIADSGLLRILKVNPAGALTIVAGTGEAGFLGDGGPATAARIGGSFMGMAADSAGNLFFADQLNHRLRKISPDGTINTVAGSGPYGPGVSGSFSGDGGPAPAARLWWPWGVAIDAAGDVFFSDLGNSRIRKVIGIAAPGLVAGWKASSGPD